MKPLFVMLLLACAYLTVGTMDYNDARGVAEDRQEVPAEVIRPAFQLQTDPINPPRCPRINALGMPLLSGIATQADGGEWIHACHYGIRT